MTDLPVDDGKEFFPCRVFERDFFETAACRYVNRVVVDATPAQLFQVGHALERLLGLLPRLEPVGLLDPLELPSRGAVEVVPEVAHAVGAIDQNADPQHLFVDLTSTGLAFRSTRTSTLDHVSGKLFFRCLRRFVTHHVSSSRPTRALNIPAQATQSSAYGTFVALLQGFYKVFHRSQAGHHR